MMRKLTHKKDTMKILVVEDDRSLQLALKKMIERCIPGCHVECAESAKTALTLIHKEFDLILTDMNLGYGVMSGWELGRTLRKQGVKCLIAYMSGSPLADQPGEVQDDVALGRVQGFFEKSNPRKMIEGILHLLPT
ncbi:MAG: response regulator [Candidatus Magasanikbacteria bacterium]